MAFYFTKNIDRMRNVLPNSNFKLNKKRYNKLWIYECNKPFQILESQNGSNYEFNKSWMDCNSNSSH
jgi:hypothetical protein